MNYSMQQGGGPPKAFPYRLATIFIIPPASSELAHVQRINNSTFFVGPRPSCHPLPRDCLVCQDCTVGAAAVIFMTGALSIKHLPLVNSYNSSDKKLVVRWGHGQCLCTHWALGSTCRKGCEAGIRLFSWKRRGEVQARQVCAVNRVGCLAYLLMRSVRETWAALPFQLCAAMSQLPSVRD